MPQVAAFHTACPFTKLAVCTCDRVTCGVDIGELEAEALLVHEMYSKENPTYEKEFGNAKIQVTK